jgi:hypothetical protein
MPALSANAHHPRQLRLPSRTLEEDRTTCSATCGVRWQRHNDVGGMNWCALEYEDERDEQKHGSKPRKSNDDLAFVVLLDDFDII